MKYVTILLVLTVYVNNNTTDLTYFITYAKHTLNNIQRVHTLFAQSSMITNVSAEFFFLKQELFIAHFAEASHNVGNDLKVRLINQTDNIEERRKTEHFWQDELDTFQSNELNGRKVALLFCGFSTETFKNGFHQKIP